MESEVASPHRRSRAAFDQMLACEKIWSVSSTQLIDSVRARTTAAYVSGRRAIGFSHGADPLVSTSEAPMALPAQGGKSTAYFYPGFVLVAANNGSDFALVDLAELQLSVTTAKFNETEAAPRDTAVIGKTWAKSNKDGSRDRRFKDNREIPVAVYGDLKMSTEGGLNEAFMTSRVEPCLAFGAAIQELQKLLRAGRSGHRIANQRTISPRY
ncbi:hypothetical protein ACELLULO517_26515 [Acidisoma cellulosilytica]|uniref:Uncharacterized protein n=1 Tax=Acidisoma cellulosilyticum TaxID=2802395 RepID=A0A963Z761_9PROT|nr:hypothetical protein [Acidisoma cellulosilyticum]MCB8883828.1 hypothetical protein [Acidisoma cellulosilyticum]